MQPIEPGRPPLLPPLGCLAVVVAMLLLCLMPLFLIDVLHSALARLHLPGPIAALSVAAILVGSMVNVPVYRIPRGDAQPELVMGLVYWGMMAPQYRYARRETVVAVNVGGCVVPVILAAWQVLHIARLGAGPAIALAIVAAVDIAVCFLSARPLPGIGIVMPAFISPLAAVLTTWLICGFWEPAGADNLAPIAFTAGIAGPLIGADLLHLKDLPRTPVGVMSIGGAGTFDGIILSGVLAALLA